MSGGLAGKTVVNTRAVHQATVLDALIRDYGAEPLSYPCIAIQPSENLAVLKLHLKRLFAGKFDWLVLTSANTVYSLAQSLEVLGLLRPPEMPFKVATVGPSTAEAVAEYLNFPVALMPDDYVAESLAATLLDAGGKYFFLPESAIARPTLGQKLRDGGGVVEAVVAYDTVCASGGVPLFEMVAENRVDAVTFTSSSTVNCFMERLRMENSAPPSLERLRVACIGPKTAYTAREHGLTDCVTAEEYTLEGMLAALHTHFLNH